MQGIHTMSAEEYHKGPCPAPELSNSIIKTLLTKSPLHAKLSHRKLNPNYRAAESNRLDLGTAAHAMLLEGVDDIVVVDAEDWRTKAAKEARDAAHAMGKVALLTRHYNAAKEMVVLAMEYVSRTSLAGIFDSGKPEQTVIWTEDNGVWCKARPDYLSDDRSVIVDYKTTSATNPGEFIRSSMVAFGYDVQAEWYTRGMAQLGHKTRFVFLVQEDTAPFSCYLVELAPSMQELARLKIARAIELWGRCLHNDDWPAYDDRIYWAESPAWAMQAELSRE